MLISNLRNKGDLEAKKRLRDDLLELEANNEAELDKRVKDYKNPNKPIPVAPQYKSANEMRKDRLNQEKEAIKNFADLGLDYADGAEMISWLSSSLIDKLVEFNANFKGIKKELVETTNPKLITTDFLKNYLERYFEDLDVSFGRKFATKGEQMETLKTTEELERIVPTKEILSSLRTILIEESIAMRNLINTNEEQIRRNLSVFSTEQDKKIYRETREKEILVVMGLYKKNYVNIQLLMLYDDILPSNEFIGLLKSSLTQKDRSDLIRRYLAGLKSVNMLSVEGIDELLKEYDENSGVGYTYNANLFINKVSKALSFLLDDGKITKITKLVRDYENIIKTYEGRELDLENIKRFIAFNEAKIAQQKALINETLNREVNSFTKEGKFMGEYKSGVDRIITEEAIGERLRAGIEEADVLREAEADRGRALAEIEERKENEGISQLKNRLNMELEDKRAKKIREKLKNRGIGIREYYKEFLKEIEDFYLNSRLNRGRSKVQVITDLKRFLVEDLGFSKVEVRNKSPKLKTDEYFYSLLGMLGLWIEENRINAYEEDMSFNYNRPTKIPTLGGTQMSYGVGLRENIKIRQIKSPMLDFERKFSENKSVSSAKSVSGGEIKFQHSRIKVGSGISVKQTPNYKTFGKYVIHLGHLADRNVANFKYPSLGSIPHIKPLTISEEYKEFILDTLDNGRPNERLLKNLSMEEQKHFEKVCLGAGLLDTFKIKRGNTEEEKKAVDRFNVLRGEVLAGNNNEKVIKELKLLIIKLMNDGKLNKNEATNMLIELSVL
jgi:hypothetical protein